MTTIETADTQPLLRWIVMLPLLAAVVHGLLLGLVRRPLPRGAVIGLSVGAPALSFVLSCIAVIELIQLPPETRLAVDAVWTWIASGSFHSDVAFLLDLGLPSDG